MVPIPAKRHILGPRLLAGLPIEIDGVTHTSAQRYDSVTETPEHLAEEGVVLHAVATASSAFLDDAMKQVSCVKRNAFDLGVVEIEVLEGDLAELVSDEFGEEGELLGCCWGLGNLDVMKADVVEVRRKLGLTECWTP